MTIDIEKLKQLANESSDLNLSEGFLNSPLARFIDYATPQAIIELIDRLERAEIVVNCVIEAWASYERFGSITEMEGTPLIYASVLEELNDLAIRTKSMNTSQDPLAPVLSYEERIDLAAYYFDMNISVAELVATVEQAVLDRVASMDAATLANIAPLVMEREKELLFQIKDLQEKRGEMAERLKHAVLFAS